MTVKTGDLVFCLYRMPPLMQPWLGPVWIGEVVEPGDDPKKWNGSNSERQHCEAAGLIKVRYAWGVSHEQRDSLRPADHLPVALGAYGDPTVVQVVYPDGTARKASEICA